MLRTASAILLGLVFGGQLVWAQVTTGTISGVVKDESGAVVPGVTVAVKNLETGMAREVATDAQGRYRAPNLPLGNYEVQAGLSGFQTAVRTGITLRVGQEAAVDFTLKVGEVTARVEVTGEAPLVEQTRSDVSGVIEQQQVSDLPLNGRSYLQLAELQPGVVATRNAVNVSYGGVQSVLAVGGAQSTSGVFLLDGTDISDYKNANSPGGASGMAIGVDMIREFRVLTNSFSAEYGRTAGGVLAVVSKGGTNQLHGTALEFLRNEKLDARNFFDGPIPPYKRNQFGGTVAGPIVKDKTFFLLSYEGLRERLGRTGLAIVPNAQAREGILPANLGGNVGVAPQVKPFVNLYPLPNGPDLGNGTAQWNGTAGQPTNEDFFSIRGDHIFSEKDSLFGRYTYRDGVTIDPFGSTPVPGFPTEGDNRTQFTSAEETHVFSPNLLNTFRAAFNRNSRGSQVDSIPPEVSISLFPKPFGLGPITIGSLSNLGNRVSRPAFGPMNVYEVVDTVDFTRGRHSVKAGMDILRVQVNYNYLSNFNGSVRFSTMADFLAGRPTQFTGQIPGSDAYRGWRWSTYAFYVQDEFRVLPNLTLNLGLRYEPSPNPTEVNNKIGVLVDPLKDTAFTRVNAAFAGSPGSKLLQPRFGFAWDPFKNGKLAVRGGFGVYFDRFFANARNGDHLNPPFATQLQVTNPPFPYALAGGGTVGSLVSPSGTLTYGGFSYPYAMQWNFTLQREIVPSTVVSASYAGSRGVHIVVQGNLNLNRWEFRDGRKFFPLGATKINPVFGEIAVKLPEGNSFYHSLQFTLKRRLSQGLQFQAAYTWSKSVDDGSTFGAAGPSGSSSNIPDLSDLKLGRGLADIDMRHNFVVSTTYNLPFGGAKNRLGGWQLGGIVTLTSGFPFSALLGFDRARSGTSAAAYGPDLVGKVKVDSRNVGNYFNVDAFQLEPAGYFGNVARNSIIGPGLATVDFSVVKNTSFTERLNMQWRFEAFNVFNRANFLPPGGTPASGGGPIIFTSANGIPVSTAGKILATSTHSRQIQLALKFVF